MNYGIAFATLFSRYLEANGYKHGHDEDGAIVTIGFAGGYESFSRISVLMKFGDSGEDVQLQAPGFAVVPELAHAQAVFACNEVNERFRWIKFAVSSGGQLRLTSDVAITPMMDGEVLCGLVLASMRRFIRMADHAYSMFCEYVDMNIENDTNTGLGQQREDDRDENLSFYTVNNDGESVKCDAILMFEHEGRHFIVYTDNTTDGDGSTRIYASILNGPKDSLGEDDVLALELVPITDEADWDIVQTALVTAVEGGGDSSNM